MTQQPLDFDFVCYGCGNETPDLTRWTCPVCGEPFSLRLRAHPLRSVFEERPASLWRYADLLPIAAPDNAVTMGEGATPLVDAPRLAQAVGVGEIRIKNEMANPTGSFKDRQVAVGLNHARECGADTVVVVSSGNVACATSAYAARAGLRAILLMHGHAAPDKVALAAVYGGTAIQVDSPSAAAVFELCVEACNTFGWSHLSTAGIYNPYNVEGAKTIAYELYQQYEGRLPDWIVAPVGGGGLLGGVWRGLLDLKRLGLIDRLPRLAGVQASGCAPLKTAIDDDLPFLETLKHPWPNPETIAGGIADDILFDGHTVLPAIRTTRGAAIAVDDDATLAAQRELAALEGLLCEPSSAVVPAALRQLPERSASLRVCCLVTGSGFKDLAALRRHGIAPRRIPPALDALEHAALS